MEEHTLPEISIVLPAYNCEKYLKKAIDSILQQTFTDFEFIVINDGSTDETERVILSYNDRRVIYVKNEKNIGLIETLNKALSLAKGRYIARMDGDDISMPNRLQYQHDYLENNKQVDVLATLVNQMDEHENDLGNWTADVNHCSASSIKKYLPINNCIAHPTIMARAAVMLKYRYCNNQQLSEDYDLWLRIAADGIVIDKLSSVLLRHRILKTSFTRTRKPNVYFKLALIKWQFIKNSIHKKKINRFILKTFLYSTVDAMKGIGKQLKIWLSSTS